MKHIRTKIAFLSMSVVTVSGILISCTKSVPYDTVYKGTGKDQVQEKSIVDTNAEYLFVASTDLANHDSTGAAGNTPYWQGEEKIVKFRFTENTLQIYQVNEEERLQDNKTNDKIVMEIPVKHVDYRCAEDRYKKCTNKEEENNDIAWDQKSKFNPKFDDMKTVGFSMLPLDMQELFGGSCFKETSSQFLGYELTADALNIQVQKVFKGDMACLDKKGTRLSSLDALNDFQSQVVYHYSFTKLNKLSSANYKAVDYPESDESSFGFFTTKTRKYDIDYSRSDRQKKQYMNRWNPERDELVYYMSDNFNKPEFAAMKKATQDAVAQVNVGLQTAGLKMRINLKDPDKKVPGDVRNSMIILVEDPVASGPLGYGPTVANPRTGEILSGRVAMYYGNYVTNVQYIYDEVIRELRREKNEATAKAAADPAKQATLSPSVAYQNQIAKYVRSTISDKLGKKLSNKYAAGKAPNSQAVASKFNAASVSALSLDKMSRHDFEKATLLKGNGTALQNDIAVMSKYCNYPAELFPFNEIIRATLRDKLGTQDLKAWSELTDAEKKTTMDILLPEVWRPTLVHELGHNLGLRHNFSGSEDKANFYSKEELAKMGVKHEVPYSSVMEYGSSELNLLPTLGKYDIAALKFGYSRTVETNDGKVATLATNYTDFKKTNPTDYANLKSYSYCSDEGVDVNPGCKRFDRGTSMTEIVNYLIQSYDDMYLRRNFRNNRENFTRMSDGAAYGGSISRFMYIRAFMERYEYVKYNFGITDDSELWTTQPFLKELKQAAIISGKFFIRVLQTPDRLCAIAKKDKPDDILIMQPLENFGDGVDCFKDAKLNEDYIVVGQTGKAFNDKKDPDSTNRYADQIDVRGIWVDKIAAAKMLFSRRVDNSSFDRYEDNYMDLPEVAPDLTKAVTGLLLDQVQSDVSLTDKNGLEILKTSVRHKVFADPSSLGKASYHWIETPMDEVVAKAVGMPMQQTSFQQILLGIISSSSIGSQSHLTQSQSLLGSFSAIKTSKAYQLNSGDEFLVKDVGTMRIAAMADNDLAQSVIATTKMIELLDKLDATQVDKLIAEKTVRAKATGIQAAVERIKTTGTADLPKSEFAPDYADIPLEIISAYKSEALPKAPALDYLLTILPSSN